MKSAAIPTSVPASLHQFFWDVDAKKLNPRTHQRYVINRLLDKGNLEAARWVLKNFPKENIIDTFKTYRDFSPWNGAFWAHYLGIPEKEVACLQRSYLTLRSQLWPY